EDDHGNLWMTCAGGIFRVRKQQLADFAEGRSPSVSSIAYGVEHGLKTTVPSVAVQPLVTKAADGRLWVTTLRGVSVVDPTKLSTNLLPPPLRIESLTIDQRDVDFRDFRQPVDAPPGRGDIAIHYTALSFLAPEKVTFK